jgi:hypothetical protein
MPPPVHKNGLALGVIISALCVPQQVQRHDSIAVQPGFARRGKRGAGSS